MSKKVLLAGESWMSYTTHVKGFDSFYTSTYETGEKWLKKALEKNGYEVTFFPNHIAAEEFPYTVEANFLYFTIGVMGASKREELGERKCFRRKAAAFPAVHLLSPIFSLLSDNFSYSYSITHA